MVCSAHLRRSLRFERMGFRSGSGMNTLVSSLGSRTEWDHGGGRMLSLAMHCNCTIDHDFTHTYTHIYIDIGDPP